MNTAMPPRVISITTDFGRGDFGVSEMVGVMYSIAGDHIRIAELTIEVPPHNILDGAVILARHTPYFPPGSIHIAVVDPGVGTHRRPIAALFGDQYYVGPDNGVFTLVYQQAARQNLPVTVIHTSNPQFWKHEVSNIFHGRDIFAPVAAHLARGVPLEEMGEPINDLVLLDLLEPEWKGGSWQGIVTRIDHFGNLESNIDGILLQGNESVEVIVGGAVIRGLVKTFGEARPGDLVAMIDSSGVIGVSVVNGSAARVLGARQGDAFTVKVSG